MNNKSSVKGFTLIELMIVITVIALMFGIVISSANFLRTSSGDAKRKADLAQLQSALQNYYADMNYFPHSSTGGLKLNGAGASTELNSGIGASTTLPAPTLKTYLREVPADQGVNYCYIPVNNSTSKNNNCDNNTSRCNYYYLATTLSNPSTVQSLPSEVTSLCPGANYFITP